MSNPVMYQPSKGYILQYVSTQNEARLLRTDQVRVVRTELVRQQLGNEFLDNRHHSEWLPVLQMAFVCFLRSEFHDLCSGAFAEFT